MNNIEIWNHIKGNLLIASLGGLVSLLYNMLPIKKIKSYEHFWITAITRFVILMLSVSLGLLTSLVVKSIGFVQYGEAACALGALGGDSLVRTIRSKLNSTVKEA
jgi:hypothetical protein